MIARLLLPLALALLATPANARAEADLPHVYAAGETVTPAPDTAYLLVRSIRLEGLRFLRVDGDTVPATIESADLVDLIAWVGFDKGPSLRTHLVSVRPGNYWLYGEKTRHFLEGPYLNCLCMGTVRFEARAGTITDLGLVRNLARETRNGKRPDATGEPRSLLNSRGLRAMLIEPATSGMPVPVALAGLPRVAATYRAAGRLPNIDGTMIDRISVIEGVIAYDRDRIIDVPTGAILR